MTFYRGMLGPCRWACVIGEFSDQDVEGFLSHLRDVVEHRVPGQLILDITHDVGMPTAVQRKQIAEIIGRATNLQLVGGHAVVVNSAVVRGTLTAINWVVRPSFEEKVFGNPRDAVAWLAERNPALDGAALLQDIERAVPKLGNLRW